MEKNDAKSQAFFTPAQLFPGAASKAHWSPSCCAAFCGAIGESKIGHVSGA